VTLFIRDPKASEYHCTLNGRIVEGWVIASEAEGWVAVQRFPKGWEVGDVVPAELLIEGIVKFIRKDGGQASLPGLEF
jgi:hypothetical protein